MVIGTSSLRRALGVAVPAALLLGAGLAPAEAARKVPPPVPSTGHQLPFVCSQAWVGGMRGNHSPSKWAIDFNRIGDVGKPVVATAAGVVTTANGTSKSGYGHYVVVDHGNGESSLYAHLKSVQVALGSTVDQGTLVGVVGSTGNVTGPHLHYEQKVGKAVAAPHFAHLPFAGGTLASANCSDVPLAGNMQGDRAAELTVFRRTQTGGFLIQQPGGAQPRVVGFGTATDEPVLGDWNGDGVAEPGVYSVRGRRFKLADPNGLINLKFGARGDRPVAGNWDGTGGWEVGVFRPVGATFQLRGANGAVTTVQLGDANDVPVTGDWNGDGRTDIGVFDRASAVFTLRHLDAAGAAVISSVQFGLAGDLPVPGDWDGNGTMELGTWTPSTAVFNQRQADANGAPRAVAQVQFGRPR